MHSFEKNVTTFYVKRGDCLVSTYMCLVGV